MNSFRPFALLLSSVCVSVVGLLFTFSAQAQTDALPPCNASFDVYDGAGTFITSISGTDQEIIVCNSDFLVLDFQNTSTPSAGSTITFGEWSLGGSIISNLANQQYQFGGDGSVFVSLTINDLDLCSHVASANIKVLGQPGFEYDLVEPSCFGVCDGSLYGTYLSDNAAFYQHTWYLGGEAVASEDWVSSACGGDYTVEVTDDGGCTSYQNDLTLDEPPAILLDISIGGSLEICPGDAPVTLSVSVDNANLPLNGVSWSWDDGLSDPNGLVTEFVPNGNNVNQFLEITVEDLNGCVANTGILITPKRSDMVGQMLVDDAPCVGCEVQCFKMDNPGIWNPWVATTTSGSGAYSFNSIGGLINCILKLVPPAGAYPDLSSVYYRFDDFTHNWMNASVITTGCGPSGALTKSISAYTPEPMNGQATISGAVYYQYTGKVQDTDPIPGVDVVVEKVPPGNSLTVVRTDAQGRFNFDFVPQTLGDTVYNFYVDLAGIPMVDNYFLTVGANDLLIQHVDFCVIEDYTAIQTCSVLSVTETPASGQTTLMVYPNPANEAVHVRLSDVDQGLADVSLVDMTGRAVRAVRTVPPGSKVLEIRLEGIAPGLYTLMARLRNGTILAERLVVGR